MYILVIILEMILIAIDQVSKYFAVAYLKDLGSVPIIKGIFSLTFVENEGAAFGIWQGGKWFFIVLTVFILVGMVVYYVKLPKKAPYGYVRLSLILIFAGAVGNLIDRVRHGRVVDFFHATFINFPVFNVADIYVVVGTIFLAILLIFVIKEEDLKTGE